MKKIFYLFLLSCLFQGCKFDRLNKHRNVDIETNSEIKVQQVNVSVFDSIASDTVNYETVVDFSGTIEHVRFGEPGEEYKENERLPHSTYVFKVDRPQSFYYNDDTNQSSASKYVNYQSFQLVIDDTLTTIIENYLDKRVKIRGTIFQGLTKNYIRDLAINVRDINLIK